jgi:hypothetical protein
MHPIEISNKRDCFIQQDRLIDARITHVSDVETPNKWIKKMVRNGRIL